MIIFSHTLTPRLQYVVDFLSSYFQIDIKIVCDDEKYLSAADPHKINYSYHRLSKEEVWIHSHVLLFETTVRQVKVECYEQKSLLPDHKTFKAFFKAEGDTGFDLFAATFYLITRYEEYLPHKKDAFGRFAHEASLAFHEGFLHLPLVNIWLENFKLLLKKKYPDLKLTSPLFRFLPTYDIDIAWSYKNKGVWRNTGALLKLFFTLRWGKMSERIKVLRGKKSDPYDAYEWMDTLHQQYSLKPIYFFLVAQDSGKFDKNIDVNNPDFRLLVHHLASKYKAGLHPSYASNDHPTLLPKEKNILEQIIDQPVQISRQHFIKVEMPATYRRLIALGITEDYSMGYGNSNGFRASIATPFYWFDLKNELATPLMIYPYCYMEATSYHESNATAEEALNEMRHYYNAVKNVGGLLITIWHNNFLGTDTSYEGWREVYAQFIAEVSDKKAKIELRQSK